MYKLTKLNRFVSFRSLQRKSTIVVLKLREAFCLTCVQMMSEKF